MRSVVYINGEVGKKISHGCPKWRGSGAVVSIFLINLVVVDFTSVLSDF